MVLQPLATRPFIGAPDAPLPPDPYRQPAQPAAATVSQAWRTAVFQGKLPSKKLRETEGRTIVEFNIDRATYQRRVTAAKELEQVARLEQEEASHNAKRTAAAAGYDARMPGGPRDGAPQFCTQEEADASHQRSYQSHELRTEANDVLWGSADVALLAEWETHNAERARAQQFIEHEKCLYLDHPMRGRLPDKIAAAEKSLETAQTELEQFAQFGFEGERDEQAFRKKLDARKSAVAKQRAALDILKQRQTLLSEARGQHAAAVARLGDVQSQIRKPENMQFCEPITV